MTASSVTSTVPFDVDGVHHGHLRLPHSRDDSAWGSVMIPITVVRHGEGPTALITGGNHGDEYEGPLAIHEMASTIRMEQVTGRLILIASMNHPAFVAGRRVSPIDGVNLNRAFPGAADGTVTQKIADYFQRVLVPMADAVLDFHSGGKTLEFLPFAAAHVLEDRRQQDSCEAAMRAFGAPYSVMLREIDSMGMYDTAVEQQGKTFVSTELGGGGTARAETVAIARRGLRNFLTHTGVLSGEIEMYPTQRITMPDEACYVFAEHAGLYEPLVDLGATVRAGEGLARIWAVDRMGQAPTSCPALRDGILIGRHFPGLIQMGDCVAVIGVA